MTPGWRQGDSGLGIGWAPWRGGGGVPQTAPAATSTAPAYQPLGSVNAETTPARAPAAAADKTQRPDAAREPTGGGAGGAQ